MWGGKVGGCTTPEDASSKELPPEISHMGCLEVSKWESLRGASICKRELGKGIPEGCHLPAPAGDLHHRHEQIRWKSVQVERPIIQHKRVASHKLHTSVVERLGRESKDEVGEAWGSAAVLLLAFVKIAVKMAMPIVFTKTRGQ